jgi:CRP-like cAMP-binding protein
MLKADVLDGFKKAGIPRNYKAGEAVFLADEPSTGMYLILKGEASVVRRDPVSGGNVEIAVVGPAQTMGEVSLLLSQAHSATVFAKTELECLLLTQSRLDDLRRDDPELALKLFEILAFTLAGHLMDMNRQLANAKKQIEKLEQKLAEETHGYSYY